MSDDLRQVLFDISRDVGGLLVERDVQASMAMAARLRDEGLATRNPHRAKWVLTAKGAALLGCTTHTDCLASPELARACWESRHRT